MSERVPDEQLNAGFQVADWFVEPLRNRASQGETSVLLEPKVMEVLCCLARRPGKTVTKQRFLDEVWTDMVVTDDVLARCISELRKAFGDDARDPRYIETIRKTGYRLIAPVRTAETPPVEGAKEGAKDRPARRLHAVGEVLWDRLRDRPLIWGGGLVLVLVAWYLAARPETPRPTDVPPTTVPFTSYPGPERQPALSADGQQVAFVWDSNTGRDLDVFVKQVGADTPLRLTDEQADEYSPVWSPDGLHLAFVRADAGAYAIFVAPVLGGGERKVADFEGREVQGINWAPNADVLAVSARRAPYGPFALYLVDVDSARVEALTDPPAYVLGDVRPAFSPDGETVAFVRGVDDEVQDVYAIPAAGGNVAPRTDDALPVTGLDWTPDGRHLVIASERGGASGLWRVSSPGDDPVRIAAAGEGTVIQDLSVARNGDRLAYTRRSYNTNIWRLLVSQTVPTIRVNAWIASTQRDGHPHIAPDGRRIAFTSRRSGHDEIWTCDRNGDDPIQLTTLPGLSASLPRWSPDGTMLAFVGRRDGQGDVYVVDAEGGTPRRLTTAPADDTMPTWSIDGRWVYFASHRSGAWQIWKIPTAGGEAVQVTQTGGRAAFESTDGSVLYYVRPDVPGIWQQPVSGPWAPGEHPEEPLVAALNPFDWGNWAVTEDDIYFIHRQDGEVRLARFDVVRGATAYVTTLEDVPPPAHFSAASDGSWFLYTQVDRDESDVMLTEPFR